MNTAKNISKLYYKTPCGAGSFVSNNVYGVLNNDGLALSEDGITPSKYISMKVAKEIALYADGFEGHCWIKVFSSAG
jgi:hypothetical protein